MSARTRKFLAKRVNPVKPVPKISNFIADPIDSRLNVIEILTLMSDYRTAYHMAHDMFIDFKEDDKNNLISITPKEIVRTISICLYLQDKLGLYQ